jgi:hypothetical protein
MKPSTILSYILFFLLGLYYFGLFNIYDYKMWLRVITITLILLLFNFPSP